MMKTALALTAHDIRRIAVEARRDPRAVRNAIKGRGKAIVELSVREAAARLGITLPERGDPATRARARRPAEAT